MNKESIYIDYMNDKIDEYQMIKNLDVLQLKSVKENGVIYTPKDIVDYMINISDITIDTSIVEPSCGHGIFVFSIINYIKDNYKLNGYDLYSWFLNKFSAFDISLNTVCDLREMLSYYFKKNFNLNFSQDTFINIKNNDSLFCDDLVFDLAIGNPPYVRTKNINSDYLLSIRNKFKSCSKGNIDLYYAFVEKYHKTCKKVCFITPNSLFTNVSGKPIRKLIQNDFKRIINFKDKIIFKDARTYTCIFLLDKENTTDSIDYAEDITDDIQKIHRDKFYVSDHVLSKENFVLSGIATLCDYLYMVKKYDDGKYYATLNGNKFEIEKDILAIYFKMTKIKDINFNHDYIICPYDENNKIIPENIMIVKYPNTYKYFLECKSIFIKRDKGKTERYEEWYAYGRKQGLHTITDSEITIVPIMVGNGCNPIAINISEKLTEFNRILFTSGFIIIDNKDKILSNDFIQYVQNNGKAWPGKNRPYYAITAKQIRSFIDNY